jgi:hypothetical protein
MTPYSNPVVKTITKPSYTCMPHICPTTGANHTPYEIILSGIIAPCFEVYPRFRVVFMPCLEQ